MGEEETGWEIRVEVECKQVIGVVSGHRQKEVEAFFDSLPKPENIQVVVMDMHEPFRQAVEMCLPQDMKEILNYFDYPPIPMASLRVRTIRQRLPPLQ
jgi:hypothetical protein